MALGPGVRLAVIVIFIPISLKKVGKRAVLVGGWRGVGKVSWGRQGGETGGSSVGGNLWPGSTHPRTATCSVSHVGLCPVLMLEYVLPRLGNMWRGISCALICWAVVNCVDWSAVKKCKNFRNEEKVAHYIEGSIWRKIESWVVVKPILVY